VPQHAHVGKPGEVRRRTLRAARRAAKKSASGILESMATRKAFLSDAAPALERTNIQRALRATNGKIYGADGAARLPSRIKALGVSAVRGSGRQ